MNFNDIFKKSFLKAVNTGDITAEHILFTILFTSIFAAYIFVVYRLITRKAFYNKNFNIALSANTVIIAAIIMTIQSSLVISLGMVGALSIVRYRTAIKDPLDLTFLFWSIAIGIICGAGFYGISVVLSIVLTIGIFILNAIPIAKAPLLLIINANSDAKEDILKAIKTNTKVYHLKSQTIERDRLDMIVEVRTQDGDALINNVGKLPGMIRCSLVSHDGEVAF